MAELHDAALRRGASCCHDWAELEKTAGKMVESSLELADRVESAQDIDRFRILDTGAKESITSTFATLLFLSDHSDVRREFQRHRATTTRRHINYYPVIRIGRYRLSIYGYE